MRSLALAAALLFVSTAAWAADDQALPPKPDYAQASAWLCRPGAETVCVTEMDALGIDAQGRRTPEPAFKVADDAPVDCFYVYPTLSREPGTFAGPETSLRQTSSAKPTPRRDGSRRCAGSTYRSIGSSPWPASSFNRTIRSKVELQSAAR